MNIPISVSGLQKNKISHRITVGSVALYLVLCGLLVLQGSWRYKELEQDVVTLAQDYLQVMTQDLVRLSSLGEISLAAETNARLKALHDVDNLVLYGMDGTVVYAFERDAAKNFSPPKSVRQGVEMGEHLTVVQPLVYQGVKQATVYLRLSLHGLRQQMQTFIQFVAGILVLLALAIFVLQRMLQRSVATPVTTLSNALVEMSRDQDYSRRMDTDREDEIGVLYQGFNHMLQQIQASQQQLHSLNEQLEQRIAEGSGALHDALALNQQILSTSVVGISAYRESGECVFANEAITGLAEGATLQGLVHNYRAVAPLQESDLLSLAGDVLKSGGVCKGEFSINDSAARAAWFNTTFARFDRGGEPHLLLLMEDVTERKRAEVALKESSRMLDEAQELAHIGSWRLDVKSNEVLWSRELYKMYGFNPDLPPPPYTEHQKLFTPKSWQMLSGALSETVDQGTPYELELETVRDDGSNGWMWVRGEQVCNEQGEAVALRGVAQDITERKLTEIKSRETGRLLDSVVENIPAMIFMKRASDLKFTLFNKAGESLTGFSRHELLGKSDYDFFPKEQADFFTAKDREVLKQGAADIPEEPIETKGKGQRLLHTRKITLYDDQGGAQYLLGISEDITEQKAAESALITARDEAQRANRAKSEFLSRMSHELRTPLNAILGFGQLLQLDTTLDGMQKESVQEIHKAGSHLLELINDVLDLAKVESGKIELSLEPVEVLPVVEDCLRLMTTLAENRGIKLQCDDCSGLVVLADRIRLKQALLNLLSNAIKYNVEGGSVTLKRELAQNGKCRLLVSDTGPGIAEDKLQLLFEPFNRLGAEQSEIEGTGIGLNLARSLVELMGGQLKVESERGVGSTFWLELESAPLPSFEENPAYEDTAAEGDVCQTKWRQTVLYVEDNPANLRLVERILQSRDNIKLLSASNGSLGIELAREQQPDVILLDINLPGMDGYQLMEVLRSSRKTSNIPVIAITANAMPADIEKGKGAGFDGYITKPMDVTNFNKMLNKALLDPRASNIDG